MALQIQTLKGAIDDLRAKDTATDARVKGLDKEREAHNVRLVKLETGAKQ